MYVLWSNLYVAVKYTPSKFHEIRYSTDNHSIIVSDHGKSIYNIIFIFRLLRSFLLKPSRLLLINFTSVGGDDHPRVLHFPFSREHLGESAPRSLGSAARVSGVGPVYPVALPLALVLHSVRLRCEEFVRPTNGPSGTHVPSDLSVTTFVFHRVVVVIMTSG